MKQYIKKRLLFARILPIISILCYGLMIALLIAFQSVPFEIMYPLVMLSVVSGLASLLVFFVVFPYVCRCHRRLTKTGRYDILDDISLSSRITKNSNILCGKYGFVSLKPLCFAVYSDVAWIYPNSNDSRYYTIRLTNGMRIGINKSDPGLMPLIRKIQETNSSIIEGSGRNNKLRFFAKNPLAVVRKKRVQLIFAAALVSFSIAILISNLARQTLDLGIIITNAIIWIASLLLVFSAVRGTPKPKNKETVLDKLRKSKAISVLSNISIGLCAVGIAGIFFFGSQKNYTMLPIAFGVYAVSMLIMFPCLFLNIGTFKKPQEKLLIHSTERLDDTSKIFSVITSGTSDKVSLHRVYFSELFDWNHLVECMISACKSDFVQPSISADNKKINLSFLKNKCKIPAELYNAESGVMLSGRSNILGEMVFVNIYKDSSFLTISTTESDKETITRYFETFLRKNFGTKDEMKPAQPCNPISIKGSIIYLNSLAYVNWKQRNSDKPEFSFTGSIPIEEREPVITLVDDGDIACIYRLQTEGDEDFTGKYFNTSIRIFPFKGNNVLAAQVDGFIADTPEDTEFNTDKIGYRMEGYIMNCGGKDAEFVRSIIKGNDLVAKGLKYQGYTTPTNVRLVGFCPECKKSFTFHGYACYMIQNDVAYSDDGQQSCTFFYPEKIDKDVKFEFEGITYRYHNSFCCPHCGAPYIDYRKNPEMKQFGVSDCVHLGKKSISFIGEISFDNEPEQEVAAESSDDYIDDITFIRHIVHTNESPWHKYDIQFAARGYGWDNALDWADYVAEKDLEHISEVTTGTYNVIAHNYTDQYTKHGKCVNTPELKTEQGYLTMAGMSKTLSAPTKIVWINQTNTMRIFTLKDDEDTLKRYAETLVRRTFGTEDAMKLGKPIPEGQ